MEYLRNTNALHPSIFYTACPTGSWGIWSLSQETLGIRQHKPGYHSIAVAQSHTLTHTLQTIQRWQSVFVLRKETGVPGGNTGEHAISTHMVEAGIEATSMED